MRLSTLLSTLGLTKNEHQLVSVDEKSQIKLSNFPGFVLWPTPHSQMALHLLDLLYVEMRVPGTAFREHLLASNHLSLKRLVSWEETSANHLENRSYTQESFNASVIYHLHDVDQKSL